jgi:hypothetical protein
VLHCDTQVLCGCLISRIPRGYVMRGAVVRCNMRVLHGKIGYLFVEFTASGIASGFHSALYQAVGVADCSAWIVNEPLLHSTPLGGEGFRFRGAQVAQMQPFHSFCAQLELVLGFESAAALAHEPVILGPKP